MRVGIPAAISVLFHLSLGVLGSSVGAEPPVVAPEVYGKGLEMVLFAREPMIQQPIGAVVDDRGRLLVIESQTHFRPENWEGPETDQVVALLDDDGDDKADRREVFFDGSKFTMDIALGEDGWVYLATRNEILRVRDKDGDGRAEEVQRRLVWVDTEGSYPHNGLSGLAPDGKGGLFFGMGENLGVAYAIQGSDGLRFADQAEGGNVWFVKLDGSGLRRVATGFWNPFGVCVDPSGAVFATDNDPGSRPPCRLIHVVEGGDYGFQFRYGRSGLHPFVSWDGKRPGILPGLTSLGEAPCDILCYLPKASPKYRGLPLAVMGRLLVASWGDHRVEGHALAPRMGSATFNTGGEVLCQGGADFWPVGLAMRADGALYVTDWAQRNYELHGAGRVWLIRQQQPVALPQVPTWSRPLDPAIAFCEQMAEGPAPTEETMLEWLSSEEPVLFLTAARRLSRDGALAKRLAVDDYQINPRVRVGLLLAARLGTEREGVGMEYLPVEIDGMLRTSIQDMNPFVALTALQWVADHRIQRYRFMVQGLVNNPEVTEDLLVAALTALDRIDFPEEALFSEKRLGDQLRAFLAKPNLNVKSKLTALKVFPGSVPGITAEEAGAILEAAEGDEKVWMAHFLGQMKVDGSEAILRKLAFDESAEAPVRAAALTHLELGDEDAANLLKLVTSENAALRGAALSELRGLRLSFEQQQALKALAGGRGEMAARRVLGESFFPPKRPLVTDVKAWRRYLAAVPGEPDTNHGRAVFLSAERGGCAVCHRAEHLGNPAGPDLTLSARGGGWEHVMTGLLQPSASVAPQYAAWALQTVDGQSLLVFQLSEEGGTHRYMDMKGQEHVLKIEQISRRQQMLASVMPEGLVQRLTDEEIRDLISYLLRIGREE